MQRLTTVIEDKQDADKRLSAPELPFFKMVRTRIYALSPLIKLKDLGIITLLDRLNQVGHQHNDDLALSYSVMNPVATNRTHLIKAYSSIQIINKKLRCSLDIQEVKYNKTKSARGRENINNKTQDLIRSAREKMAFFENEVSNRQKMLDLLNHISMPTSFKKFMIEINKLSVSDKHKLVSLLTCKEHLLQKRELIAAPYELMFVYNASLDDFMVGIRSRYDHDHPHPHPTVIGGDDPEVLVAGTIDLCLVGDILKVIKIRNDSGHYKPEAESFELIMRYIQQELNPQYYDQVLVGSVEGDTATPTFAFRK